jgi:hypothetical protein
MLQLLQLLLLEEEEEEEVVVVVPQSCLGGGLLFGRAIVPCAGAAILCRRSHPALSRRAAGVLSVRVHGMGWSCAVVCCAVACVDVWCVGRRCVGRRAASSRRSLVAALALLFTGCALSAHEARCCARRMCPCGRRARRTVGRVEPLRVGAARSCLLLGNQRHRSSRICQDNLCLLPRALPLLV